MAAAYAALMSLMHTSEQILHPSQQWIRFHRNLIESMLQKVRFLQEFLEDYSHKGHVEMAGLESRIANIAYASEDIIESHVVDQILARSTGGEAKSSTSFSEHIQKLIEEMEDLIETKVIMIKETIGEEDPTVVNFSPAVSSRLAPNYQNTLVGFDEKLNEIMDRLTGQQSSRQILAIVGMGGIGKTTLAKGVYEHPHIKHYFDVCAWATISQKYSARNIILQMLSGTDQSKQESDLSDDQLGEQLYKSLCGMRYLIVMDDFWDIEVWDEISAFFPHNCNVSRILITTRLLNVARQLNSFKPFEMKCLDDGQSWELLCDKVFGKEGFPSELEQLGKDIAIKCRGLPLAIIVIGRLLAKSNKTLEFWGYVAENLNSVVNSEDDENCLKILYLSYNNLPIHLKPCFLYMATVPEKQHISVRYLTILWVAEGFLKPLRDKSLEEVANEYIADLIDRNLIITEHRRGGASRRTKICSMHDLLRDLCQREAQKENFLSVIDERNPDIPLEISFKRRLYFHRATKKFTRPGTELLDLLRPTSLTRSLIGEFDWAILLASSVRLLRVLDMEVAEIPPKDTEIMQLVNLRLLFVTGEWGFNSMWRFTSSISQFWRLQSLIFHNAINKPIFLPSEIWDLPQLRHLCFSRVVLPDPPRSHNDENDSHTLEYLQTLFIAVNFRCTKEVLKRVPNLKKLEVVYDCLSPEVNWLYFCLHDLVHLRNLESLAFDTLLNPISVNYLSFPHSLKELNLLGCHLPWEDMTVVGSLPNLEILVLEDYAFKGEMWCPVEGDFIKLKMLVIVDTDLLHWRADKTQFPILEHLILQNLYLEEIPRELLTLKKIELFNCSDSAITSAYQLREEQESWGYECLEVEEY